MKVYHATKAINEILNEGFKIPKYDINTVGRFGAGIYFGTNIEKACEFGDINSIITAIIDTKNILKFNYIELMKWFPNKNISIEDYESVIERNQSGTFSHLFLGGGLPLFISLEIN